MSEENSLKTSLIAGIIVILLIPPMAIYHGFVLTKLWTWFMVPVFGLPNITLLQAIGLSLVTGYLTRQYAKREDDHIYMLCNVFLYPLIALVIGYIVYLLM